MPTPVVTLVVAEPTAEPTSTATSQPTHTPAPTNTPLPTPTNQAQDEPHMITQGETTFREGPGEQFALIAQLDQNRWAEGLEGQVGWLEIRIGIGQTGWVKATAVAVNEFCPTP
jgi:uncharacterized protein YgiM (DUF1202 family)